MKRIDFLKLSGILLISLASSLYTKAESIASDTETKAVNVILFIGDGMSLAQWQTGMVMSDTPLNIERMRSVGIVRTNSSTDFNGDGPSHGTAIASGINTRKGAVGLDANDKPVKTIIEYRRGDGTRIGQYLGGREYRAFRCPSQKPNADRRYRVSLRGASARPVYRRWKA